MALNFRTTSTLIQLACAKVAKKSFRCYATTEKRSLKVTVCGAAGKIGHSLSLMLKQSTTIDTLVLHDVVSVGGVAVDLSHVDTKCKVIARSGAKQMEHAFKKSDIVVVVACAPKMSSSSYIASFESNAAIMKCIAETFAKVCPKAILIIATNPVNSLVPLASEVLASYKVLNIKKVFGVTTLNIVRANTFVGEVLGVNPENVVVPVVGGGSGATIVPLLSQTRPCLKFTTDELEQITYKLQNAHQEVIRMKYNNEEGHLSCSYAIAKFVLSVAKALRGANNIIKCAFVRSKAHPHTKYLATPLLIGKEGIEKIFKIPPDILEYEKCLVERAVTLIVKDVRAGEAYVDVRDPAPCDPCTNDPKNPCPKDWCSYL